MNDLKITKNAALTKCEADKADANDLELISKYTRRELSPDELYTFTVILCDNEIDRDNERFSLEALNAFKKLFTGVTGIFDHSMKSSDQTARIYKTEVMTDSLKTTRCNEPYTYLKAWCYMLKTKKNEELIKEIDGGIKKEISIGCSVASQICSVCGKDIRSRECPHTKGETVNGKMCHAILDNPADAYEWSFVAVPSQRKAGVSKSAKGKNEPLKIEAVNTAEIIKSLSEAQDSVILSPYQIKSLENYITAVQKEAEIGKTQRILAEKEIIALAAYTLPEADMSMFPTLLSKLCGDEIFMLKKAFSEKAEKLSAYEPVFKSNDVKSLGEQNENSQFKI